MAIDLPILDDKTYAELTDEARSTLPAIYPAWTDHNPSDPGIALIELFAWFTEVLIYRTGRIPSESERAFLRLLSDSVHGSEADLGAARAATLSELRERYRAVTPDDYEYLATYTWPESREAAEVGALPNPIARVKCIPERNLSSVNKTAHAPGHISLIIMRAKGDRVSWEEIPDSLRDAMGAFFRDRNQITTRLHIVPPTALPIRLRATLCLRAGASRARESVRTSAQEAILRRFDPWRDGREGKGWPFGKSIYLSELYALLDEVPGVAHVEDLVLTAPDNRTLEDGGVRLYAHELPQIIEPIQLDLKELRGNQWILIE